MIKKIKDKFLTREVISYLIFGVLTTLVNIVSFWICDSVFSIYYVIANIIAWIVSVAFAYITNKLYVFQSKSFALDTVLKELAGFLAARILSLLFDLGFMIFAVEVLHMPEIIAKILSNFVVVVINYVASKLFIFKNK